MHRIQQASCGRFAPSPTGDLHAGSLLAAVASFLFARRHGGRWLLRVEDIDPPREVPGSAARILAALQELGLQADAPPLLQSRRGGAYEAALRQLRDQGQAFPCWCSRGDLAGAAEPHRDGRCVAAPRGDRPPAWRLRAPAGHIGFDDLLQGPQRQDVREAVGDFVLRRADGLWSYQLACVVDDAHQGVTEVVRGHDLLDSTPRQILLQRLLGLPTPVYAHIPLLLDREGRKLSKSSDAPAVDQQHPLATLQRTLRLLGQHVPDAGDAATLLARAARDFDPAPLRRASVRPPDAGDDVSPATATGGRMDPPSPAKEPS